MTSINVQSLSATNDARLVQSETLPCSAFDLSSSLTRLQEYSVACCRE